jgi:gluconolactonase
MYGAPPELLAEVFAELPTAFRTASRPSRWAVQRHADPFMHSFLEGPSFDRQGRLYVVDIPRGRIFRISPTGEFSLFAEYDGEPNGLRIHRDGSLYVADHRHGILRFDAESGGMETLCDKYLGRSFHGVNDLVFSSDGVLYFTDQGESDLVQPFGRVFRVSPGGEPELIKEGFPSPNGLVLTEDERHLLVAVTKGNAVWRVPLHRDGSAGRVGLFVQLSGSAGGGPDGLAMDESGNLAVAHPLGGSVWLFNPQGEPVLRVRSPAGPVTTNLAYGGFGRDTLFITESRTGSILRCRMPIPGRRLYSHSD